MFNLGQSCRLSLLQLLQHTPQDPAVAVVFDLDFAVDAGLDFEVNRTAVVSLRRYIKNLARRQPIGNTPDCKCKFAIKTEAVAAFAVHKLQWENPHADQVAAVNPFV